MSGFDNYSQIKAKINNIRNGLQTELYKDIFAVAKRGFDMSQSIVHVITGFLKGSGKIEGDGKTHIEIIYAARYAGFEEFGTVFRPAHHYLAPSMDQIKKEIPKALETAFKRIIA